MKGKTITETFATAAELQKAQREIAAYQQFRELSHKLIEISEKICRARPLGEDLTMSKRTGGGTSSGNQPRNRAVARAYFLAAEKTGGLDLKAVEMAVRSAMHQAGAFTQLLQSDPPGPEERE